MNDVARAKCGRRGVGHGRTVAPLPTPTRTAPGSPERLAVLAERATRGEQLFHPADASAEAAELGTAPRRQTDRTPRTYAEAITAPQLPTAPAPDRSASSGRPVPGLTLHRGVRVWRAAFKVNGRRRVVYFGRDFRAASERYARWAATWPAPLLADVPPTRDRARLLDTPAGPVRLHAAARAAGLRPGTVAYRLDVLGWPVAVALSTPRRTGKRQAAAA